MPTRVLRVSVAGRAARELPHRLVSAAGWGLNTGTVRAVCWAGEATQCPTLPSDGRTATANKVSIIAWGALCRC